MKNIKIIILMLLIIICSTGCSGVYTLKFNNDMSLTDDLVVEENDTTERTVRDVNINRYKKIYKQAFHYDKDINNYYESSSYGIKIHNDYNTIDDYNNSDICKSFNCKIENEEYDDFNIINITLDYDSFVFRDCGEGDLNGPQYVYFDIEMPFEIIDTNAYEKITDNKYRWVLHEKDLKRVTIKYTTDEIKERNMEKARKQWLIAGAVVLGYVLIVAFIIVRRKAKK